MAINLEKYLQKLLGSDYNAFCSAKNEPVAVRVNTLKQNVNSFIVFLQEQNIGFEKHPINPTGIILEKDTLPFSQTLNFFLGKIFYQGFSSQLPVLALDPKPGELVLDIAAAPGSKSTQIGALLQNKGILVVNDASVNRQQGLLTNMYRAGIYNDIALQLPGQRMAKIFPDYFDKVLVDAPCSGLGAMPTSKALLNREYPQCLSKLKNIQYHIFMSALKATKPGGTLVYSTCSVSYEENEQLIEKIITEYPVELLEINNWEDENLRTGYMNNPLVGKMSKRVFPYPKPYEAFFVAKLRKTDRIKNFPIKPIKYVHLQDSSAPQIKSTLEWISNRWKIELDFFNDFNFHLTQKKLWLVSKEIEKVPEFGFVKAGIPFAENRGREWKLTNSSVQMFADVVHQTAISLEESDLINLFKLGKMPYKFSSYGYFLLEWKGEKIGIVSLVDGNIKIHLPHYFDLVL